MKQKLLNMLSLLQEYRRSKEDLMHVYITERLDKSYALYTKELDYSMNYLKCKHEKSILKRLKKLDNELS